jgi:phosphatidylglycerophosphate synthase
MLKNKKEWGIFVPYKIQKILYPTEKIEYESGYIFATILRRISVIITFYVLYPLRVHPNIISLLSIILIFISSYLFINGLFFIGAILVGIWVLLDCVDGELARILNKKTKVGGSLEKLNSDILYILFLPSLSIGLYDENIISLPYVFYTFISVTIFNVLRVYISTFPKVKKEVRNKKIILFLKCQFKNNIDARKKNILFSFIFYFWRNIFTQCGILELTLIVITFPGLNTLYLLKYFILFFIIGYTLINLMIFLGILIFLKIGR